MSYLETESKAGLHYEAEVALQPLVFTFDEVCIRFVYIVFYPDCVMTPH